MDWPEPQQSIPEIVLYQSPALCGSNQPLSLQCLNRASPPTTQEIAKECVSEETRTAERVILDEHCREALEEVARLRRELQEAERIINAVLKGVKEWATK